ncbi:MAG: DNA-binding response regulator [Chloroflexi bacterium RBG_19FT_COMBO_50_10]|nr:MAG: DNA-binding response regulator [Chloroflexi bacterium RBG_19FT_COMBO_50_10]
MSDRIRVLIADDHPIVRSGLRLLLEAEADIDVVGEALDGVEALNLIQKQLPDVVLMDIAMPGMDGLEATRQIKERWPQIKVLVLTMHRSDEYFFEMLKSGASGYILKGAETSDLIRAVRVVGRGEVFLYPTMAQKLVKDYLNFIQWSEESGSSLSSRETEILRLLSEGFSSKEIAEKLVISPSTVHSHRSNIMSKLGLNSRHELIQYARQRGLIQDE